VQQTITKVQQTITTLQHVMKEIKPSSFPEIAKLGA
jgi:hypothetical protein